MDREDIKKVNSENTADSVEQISTNPQPATDATEAEKENAFEEIMNGMQDLARLYANEETTRERQMREQDELRRAKEMEAIREDIERRYSMQVEEAQSNMDSIMGNASVPVSSTKGENDKANKAVDYSAIRNAPEKAKKEKVKKVKKPKKKKIDIIDLDEKNSIYALVYSLGEWVITGISMLINSIFYLISTPISRISKKYKKSTNKSKNIFRNNLDKVANDFKLFGSDLKNAHRYIKKAKTTPRSIPYILGHYLGKIFKRHSYLLNSLVNSVAPVLALVVMLVVFNYWQNVTIALNIIYNGNSIGYITDESVYIEARDLVTDRLNIVEKNSDNKGDKSVSINSMNASYQLAIVSLDELNDAHTISDKMIENSVDNLTTACGIYIDDELICAVKNEADAKTVFYNIIEPYEDEANAKGYVVTFAESIDYVQGLYPDESSVMWDASQLEKYIMGEDSEEGEMLVHIKKTVTSSKIAPVQYKIVKKRDLTKYSGYRMVTQKGADGTQRVITTTSYIDGKLDGTTVRYEIITEAVDEIVVVGTRTTYGGIYIGEASDYGFLWPAPNCHYISSTYGWRSSGWHKGLDLCTTNNTAYGSPVIAAKSGVVEMVQKSNSGYGHMVLIDHGDGYMTRYAHMISGSITVKVGETVEAGQTIGKVGSTGNSSGPHLHFEVIYNGENYDPKNFIY